MREASLEEFTFPRGKANDKWKTTVPRTVGQGLAEHPQVGLRMPTVGGGAVIPSRGCRGDLTGEGDT